MILQLRTKQTNRHFTLNMNIQLMTWMMTLMVMPPSVLWVLSIVYRTRELNLTLLGIPFHSSSPEPSVGES
jgi:hypothetical protein